MDRRTTKRPVSADEFLCLCIALGDEEIADEAWDALDRISGRDAEHVLLGLEDRGGDEGHALEAAQLFLKDRVWGRSA